MSEFLSFLLFRRRGMKSWGAVGASSGKKIQVPTSSMQEASQTLIFFCPTSVLRQRTLQTLAILNLTKLTLLSPNAVYAV